MARRKREVPHVHDLSWRQLLENRTALQRLLQDYVPDILPLVRRLNFKKAEIVPTSFVERTLRAMTSDIIWKIPLRRKRHCLLYVLVEHQSKPRHLKASHVVRHLAALYSSIEKAAGKKKASSSAFLLPLIVPVVLYCGADPWNAPLRFDELLSLRIPALEPFLASRYPLIDVKRLDEGVLLRLRNALSGLFLLEKGRLSGNEEYFESAITCLAAEKDRNLLEAVVVTAYNILKERGDPRSPKKIAAWFRDQKTKEHGMAQTMREYLEKIGRKRERQEGLERALLSLRKALLQRDIDPKKYERDMARLSDVGKVTDMIVKFMAAKNPHAYLRRRFGH
jgi:hypothetical protein